MTVGRGLRNVVYYTTTSPAVGGGSHSLGAQTEAIRQHYARTNMLSKQYLSADTAPKAAIVNDGVDYEFLMQGNGTPNLEIPYLLSPEETDLRANAFIALPRGINAAALSLKLRSQTLLTSVTTATSNPARCSPASPPRGVGWKPNDTSLFDFWTASIALAPSDLGTARLQALGLLARWDVENTNVYESTGVDGLSMDLDVYLLSLHVVEYNLTYLSGIR